MWARFDYTNIVFTKHETEDWLIVKGEITNKTGKDYKSVVFIVTLLAKSIPLGSAKITINGFYSMQTRTFETHIEELEYDKVMSTYKIDWDIQVESWY